MKMICARVIVVSNQFKNKLNYFWKLVNNTRKSNLLPTHNDKLGSYKSIIELF